MSLQGLLLTTIGSTVFIIGVLLMLYANIKKTVCNILWENEQVRYSRPRYTRSSGGQEPSPRYPSYVFSLQYPSLVKGEVSSREGSYTLSICEYFGPHVTPESLSKSKIYYKKETPQESFELELSHGVYCIYFLGGRLLESDEVIEAKFSVTECHDDKPHGRWFSVGQTLWEVGIPLLITGLVSFLLIP